MSTNGKRLETLEKRLAPLGEVPVMAFNPDLNDPLKTRYLNMTTGKITDYFPVNGRLVASVAIDIDLI